MQFLITSCNNFNPYVHPMYYSVRNRIKYNSNRQSFGDFESLFRNTDARPMPLKDHMLNQVQCNPIYAKHPDPKDLNDKTSIVNQHISPKSEARYFAEDEFSLYDSVSFCCNKPFNMKTERGDEISVFKNDFIKNIVKLSYDPVGFVEVNKNSLNHKTYDMSDTEEFEDQDTEEDDDIAKFNYIDTQTAKDLLRYMALKNRYTDGRGIVI